MTGSGTNSSGVMVMMLCSCKNTGTDTGHNMNTVMHIYATNGKLIMRSSHGDGFDINSTTGQSQLVASITDSRVKDVRAFVFFY